MAVVDLETRLTKDWKIYNSNLKSSDSLIYISPHIDNIEDGPSSLDLSVGNKFLFQDSGKYYIMPEDGVYIEPFSAILIETEQRICLPLNVFGIVIGKGHQIYQGTFISSGKINPGFQGKLNIGLYNGSRKKILIKKGQPLCSCVFFQMESNKTNPLKDYDNNTQVNNTYTNRKQKIISYVKANKDWLPIVISIVSILLSVLVSVSIGVTNRNFILYQVEQSNPKVDSTKNDNSR
ncbi:dCTP deaminase domain-containing protein [Spirosoma sp. KUDC1026]|uniref:dCTP deaminase domain-containing protein n=1 Tax=Spirosoma sp. KUDC1026 TaxID=2745947 RepID=UPI00159BA6F8|nr:hypothetical protein [Spirosoma sp. KUDC1026]QKZ15094.1 hypothetical protein HU175_21715 [Spirosoma sp. KUDC1026]